MLSSGLPFEGEESHRPLGKDQIFVHVMKTPVKRGGAIIGLQGIFWDITEQREAEKRLKQSLADLERTNRELELAQTRISEGANRSALAIIAYSMAHEIRTPLFAGSVALRRFPVYLKQQKKGALEECRKLLGDSFGRAQEIIETNLRVSRGGKVVRTSEDLQTIIEKAESMVKRVIDKPAIRWQKHFEPNLPKVLVDKGYMWQVFINIFRNSLEAMGEFGKIVIDAKRGPTNQIVIRITNSGKPIPEDVLKSFRENLPLKSTEGELRLGLATSQSFLRMQNGQILAENPREGGARITMTLECT